MSIFSRVPKRKEETQPQDFFFNEIRKYTIEERKKESNRILRKYENRLPLIVDRGDDKTPAIDRHKFLVPTECTVAEFQSIIRKRIKLNSDEALFLFVGETLVSGTTPLGQVYNQYKDEDGYLYLTYMKESTFG